VIGNMQSVALVGANGSIDFLCRPEFDSPQYSTRYRAVLGIAEATGRKDIKSLTCSSRCVGISSGVA
jgi:hypothetical protein